MLNENGPASLAFKLSKPTRKNEQCHRKTFQQILREEAPRNARTLEAKARSASWLAKIQPTHARELYSVKHAALRHLFRIAGYSPVILDAWSSGRGFLLSVRLKRTRALLHVPLNELMITTQQAHAPWVAERARGKWWRQQEKIERRSCASEAA
jgi:hypothetical protein